jgi:hypothetical protein
MEACEQTMGFLYAAMPVLAAGRTPCGLLVLPVYHGTRWLSCTTDGSSAQRSVTSAFDEQHMLLQGA